MTTNNGQKQKQLEEIKKLAQNRGNNPTQNAYDPWKVNTEEKKELPPGMRPKY
ncbi:hypothetical protein M4A92_15685 [Caldibacillus thermoamylovorans]|uniref:hypothetical protein n=1 Tax=Caldibacillus thermoamylovorans TaxID=35841 RepID=UPI00203E18E5|nr:hypothetical protein [Caldibacillus thermoamylovorans]MCM3800036.1 hypothetical protein [Caldibacillus thermoamylovorans]